MNAKPLLSLLSGLGFLALAALDTTAMEHYYLTDLGPINSASQIARSINRNGLVLIGHRLDDPLGGSLLFDGTNRYDLWDLVGREKQFEAFDLNDEGIIVGRAVFGTERHAVALIKARPEDRFGTVMVELDQTTNSVAISINNDNQIIGWRTGVDKYLVAFRGSLTGAQLNLPENFFPERIGPGGHIVGSVLPVGGGAAHAAVYWFGGSIQDLGGLPDPLKGSRGLAWNLTPRLGSAVGGGGVRLAPTFVGLSESDTRYKHAFLWDVDSWQDLDVVPHPEREGSTEARGINSRGEIVGIVQPLGSHACIFRGGVVINLNFAFPKGIFIHGMHGWTLQTADAINDLGQIAGWGNKSASDVRAYMITPVRPFIERGGSSVSISWPALLEGFSLESTDSLSATASWQPVTNAPTQRGTFKTITLEVEPSDRARFFRLVGQ